MIEAAIWSLVALQAATLLGVFRTMNGRMDKLADRIDAQGAEFRAEMAAFRQAMRTEIGEFRQEMRTEIGGLRQEVRGLGQRIDTHLESHAS